MLVGLTAHNQWRNRRGGQGAGGRVPPETSDREISAELPGKSGVARKKLKKGGRNEGKWKMEKF